MKLIAAISAFLFITLAAILGANTSPAKTELVPTAFSILLFVAGTALILGAIFGRSALGTLTISGGLALCLVWLPQQYYATPESLNRSAIALLTTICTLALFFFVGGVLRRRIAMRLHRVD